MGNIYGKFSDQNSEVLTGIIQTSNNNQSTLNAAIADNDHLRSTPATFQAGGLLITPDNKVPNVTAAVQGTVGAALGNVGQAGTPSQEPGGGGNPCFIRKTPVTMADGSVKAIDKIKTNDIVLAFNETGKRIPKRVACTFEHPVKEFTYIRFADGRETGLIEDHRYWQKGDVFTPIRDITHVWNWRGHWAQVEITEREVVVGDVMVYNIEVEDLHTYIANGDACHNLKPLGPGDGGGPI